MNSSARSLFDYRNPPLFLPYPSNGPLKSTLGAANPDVYLSLTSSFNSDGPTRPPASIRTVAATNSDDFHSHSAADFVMGLNGSPRRQYGDGGRLRGAEEGLPHRPTPHFKSPRADNDNKNNNKNVDDETIDPPYFSPSSHLTTTNPNRVDWARSPNDEHTGHHRHGHHRLPHYHHYDHQQPYSSSAAERIAALLNVSARQGHGHGHGRDDNGYSTKEEERGSIKQMENLSLAARSSPTMMRGQKKEEGVFFRSPFRDAIAELSAMASPRQVPNIQQHLSVTSPKAQFATNTAVLSTTPTRAALSPRGRARGTERASSGSRGRSPSAVARSSIHHHSPSIAEETGRLAHLPPPHLASLGALSPLTSPAPSQLYNAPNLDNLIRMNRVLLMGTDDDDDRDNSNTNNNEYNRYKDGRLEDHAYGLDRRPSSLLSGSSGRASLRRFEEPSSSLYEVVALRERVRSLETHLRYSRGERKFFNHRGEALIPAAAIFDSGIYKQFMNMNLARRFYRKWLLHFRFLRRANTVPTGVAGWSRPALMPQGKGNETQNVPQRRDPVEVVSFSGNERVVPSNWAGVGTRSRSPPNPNASASIRWGAASSSPAERSVATWPSQQQKNRHQDVGISFGHPIRDGRDSHEDGEADSDLRAPLIVGSTRPPTPAPSLAMTSTVSYSVFESAHRDGEGGNVQLSPLSLSNRRVYADLGIPAHVVNYVQPSLPTAPTEGRESGLNSSTVKDYKNAAASNKQQHQQLQLVDQATAGEIKFYNEIEALHSQVRALTLNAHEASLFVSEAFSYLAAEQQREGERLDSVEDAVEAISQRVAKVDDVLAGQRRVANALKRRQEETFVQMEAERLASAKAYEEERHVLAERSASLERQRAALEVDGTKQAINNAGNIMNTLTRAYSVSPSQPTRSPSRSRSADLSSPSEVSSPSAVNNDAKKMKKEQQTYNDDGLAFGPETDFVVGKIKKGHSKIEDEKASTRFEKNEEAVPYPSATTGTFLAPIMRELLSQCEGSEAIVRGVLGQEATASFEMLTDFEKKTRDIITIAFAVRRERSSSSPSPSPQPEPQPSESTDHAQAPSQRERPAVKVRTGRAAFL